MNWDTTEAHNMAALLLDNLLKVHTSLVVAPAKDHEGRNGVPVDALVFDGSIFLYPVAVSVPTLGEPVTSTQWAVDIWHSMYDSDTGFDEGDFEELPLNPSKEQTLRGVITLLVDDRINCILQGQAEAESASEPEFDFDPLDDMDGDAASALASAGMGTDEDYGYSGEGDA